MPKYVFIVETAIFFATEVEADTLEEAVTLAKQRDVRPLCSKCTKQAKDAWSPGDVDFEAEYARLVDTHGMNFVEARELWGNED